jgi:hypothetical protein
VNGLDEERGRLLEENLSFGKKVLYYLLTVETTLLLTIGSWFFGVYPDLVTKQELKEIAPYVADRHKIMSQLDRHGNGLEKSIQALDKLDQRMTLEIRQLEVKIAKLETISKKDW